MKTTKANEYDKVMEALNFIDEVAENCNMDYAEQKRKERAYDIVADFIDKNAKR